MSKLAQYRRAVTADYEQILQLQSENYIANLTEAERKSGFLSAEFSLEQTARIAEDLGTTVAIVDGRVVGFLCAFRNEFSTGSAVIAEMLRAYPRFRFEGRRLSAFISYLYGPVCIARGYRGQGLLRGLYQAQKKGLAGQFEVGVAFVSRTNPHSLRAHVNGLGMAEVGDFHVATNSYVALVFRLPPQ
jgi:hypothetical protein